eukprot:1624607-Rhodomonas_salina.3
MSSRSTLRKFPYRDVFKSAPTPVGSVSTQTGGGLISKQHGIFEFSELASPTGKTKAKLGAQIEDSLILTPERRKYLNPVVEICRACCQVGTEEKHTVWICTK